MPVDAAAIVLAFLSAAVLCVGSNQLLRVWNSKNNKLSLRTGILFFLTLGAAIRVVFWGKAATLQSWPNQLMTAMFFVPVCLLLIGYSLLIVFYIAASLDTRTRRPLQYAVVINSVFLILCIVMSVAIKDPNTSDNVKNTIETLFLALKSFLDLTVAVLLGYFGHRFGVKQHANKTVSMRILPRSQKLFSYVNWVLVATSTARGLFNALMITIIQPQDRVRLNSGATRKATPFYIVFYFLAVEITPAICIFVTLWKRSSTKSNKKKSAPPTTPAERAVANSIDEHNGVVVRHFCDGGDSSRPAAPDWWSNFTEVMPSNFGYFNDSSVSNEDASDDDYMMFRGIVHPGSATEDAVQLNITRNRLLMGSWMPSGGGLAPDNSLIPPIAPYLPTSGGLPPISVPHKFGQGSGSPMIAGAGTPPSFDTWAKQQPGSSNSVPPSRTSSASRFSEQLEAQCSYDEVGDTLFGQSTTPTLQPRTGEKIGAPVAPFLANPSGLLYIQINQTFNQGAGSPIVTGTGTPPSFDAWTKQQQCGLSSPAAWNLGERNKQLFTDKKLSSAGSPPNLPILPSTTSCSSSHTHSDSGTSFGYWGNSDSDVRTSNQVSATSGCRPSESSVDSQIDPESQVEGNGFDDYLSPRDILLAQQKKSMQH